jgi:hypothetical protein
MARARALGALVDPHYTRHTVRSDNLRGKLTSMRTGFSESWRVSIEDDQTAHAVLYVRDACGLVPPDDPVVPPRLIGDPPPSPISFTGEERVDAAPAWFGWWQRVVAYEGAAGLGELISPDGGDQALVHKLAEEHSKVFDPPDFTSLAAWPPLQAMARATSEPALRWRSSGPRRTPDDDSRWQTMRAAALEVCAAFEVSADRLSVGVISLAVEGNWWNLPRPGVLLCSQAVLMDQGLFGPLLRRSFIEGLSRTG